MSTKRNFILQYIVSFYGLLYFIMFILPLAKGGEEIGHVDMTEKATVALAFITFATGAIFSWFNEKWGGLIISFWHVLVWAFALLIWTDAGMVLILVFPMLIPASLLIANWYKKNTDRYATSFEKEKLSLQMLLCNYGIVYLIIILVDTLPNIIDWGGTSDMAKWGYTSPLGLLLLGAALIFLIAFILSWRTTLIPGILLVVWYLIILGLCITDPQFANSGPWNVFGAVFLIQGILYLRLSFVKERKLNRVNFNQ